MKLSKTTPIDCCGLGGSRVGRLTCEVSCGRYPHKTAVRTGIAPALVTSPAGHENMHVLGSPKLNHEQPNSKPRKYRRIQAKAAESSSHACRQMGSLNSNVISCTRRIGAEATVVL